ncbi:hypothetical protein [Streptomyces sp. NPDC053048]|uniref:hypothetical protein n=1 Tax=Streptomyces sp. NPDC053048 TaxID=3365694 RepID=UPI0037D4442D
MAHAIEDADVEIKFIVPDEAAEAACRLLGLEADEGKRFTVYFWDKPRGDGGEIRLPLSEAGVIIRLRKAAKGDDDDLTAKLRPCDVHTLPDGWRANRDGEGWEFKIEQDWTGDSRVWSASLKVDGAFERPVSRDGGRSRQPRLTEDQRALLMSAGAGGDTLEGLVALGPVEALKWKPARRDLVHPLTAELWSTGDGTRFLELSLRARPADAPAAQDLLQRALLERGLRPPSRQLSKTRTVLTSLARAHLGTP